MPVDGPIRPLGQKYARGHIPTHSPDQIDLIQVSVHEARLKSGLRASPDHFDAKYRVDRMAMSAPPPGFRKVAKAFEVFYTRIQELRERDHFARFPLLARTILATPLIINECCKLVVLHLPGSSGRKTCSLIMDPRPPGIPDLLFVHPPVHPPVPSGHYGLHRSAAERWSGFNPM